MDNIFTNIGKLHVKNIHSPEYLKERIRNKVNQLAKYFIDDCDFIMGTTGGGSVLVKVRKVKENNKPEKTIFSLMECEDEDHENKETSMLLSDLERTYLIYDRIYAYVSEGGKKPPMSEAKKAIDKIFNIKEKPEELQNKEKEEKPKEVKETSVKTLDEIKKKLKGL